MILQKELFQKLVNKIIDDIGYNINIIDVDGYIIASGLKDRIGIFHEAGYEAAKKEERVDIDEESERQYKGAKAGINQPFYYKGELMGVIGITGYSKEIEEFVKVVKTMIELMVEQEFLKEKMFYRQSNKTYFANLLLNFKTEEDKESLKRIAVELGYDLEVPRSVIILSFSGKYDEATYGDIVKRIKEVEGYNREDFLTMVGSDQLLILKRRSGYEELKDQNSYSQRLLEYGEGLAKASKGLGMRQVYIGIGSVYGEIDEHVNSYREALFCIEKIRKENGNRHVASIYDFMMEYATSFLPEGLIDHFVFDYYKVLKDQAGLIETIISLSKNHMNTVETAKHLFVHRNTITFRMNKIKELTGLDPVHSYNDRILCHLISGYTYNYRNEFE